MNVHAAANAKQSPEPSIIASTMAIVDEYVYDAEWTRYHVSVVAGMDGGAYVLVEGPRGPRTWFPLDSPGQNDVSEGYVAEKTGTSGADAHCLTTLIAHALKVNPIYSSGTVEPLAES